MKNVKVCPLCGSTVDSDSNFCEYCGYSLKESTSETGKTDEPVQFDEEEAKRLQKKIAKNSFDFDDFLKQIQQIKRMGNMKDLVGMIPGAGKALKDALN